jgi:hypothetical protein
VLTLPDFPWDSLAATKQRASSFSDPTIDGPAGSGLVDLSVGTPVDPPLPWSATPSRRLRCPWLPAHLGNS